MADNRYRDFTQEAIDALNNLEQRQREVQDRIQARINRNLSTQTQVHQRLEEQLEAVSDSIDDIIKKEKERISYNKQLSKENTNYFRSISKIAPETRKILGIERDRTTSAGVFSSLSKDVIEMKSREVNLSDDELETSMYRRGILEEQLAAQQSQASALIRAKKEEDDISKFKEEQTYYDSLRGELGDEIVDKLIDSSRETENLFKQEQRTLELKKQQAGLMNQMPESIQKASEFASGLGNAIKMGLGPLFIIGALVTAAFKSFMDLENSAEEFRKTTGLTNSQMKEIRSQANQITQEFAKTGLEAKNVFDTVASLKSEFGDVSNFSNEVVAGLTLLNTNFGVASDTAGKVQGIFEQIGGLSSETATSLQLQVANMSNLAGVAPAKIFEDIAESAEAASILFRGDVKALAESAIQARRLGSNLKSVATTAEKLLDFESGISAELEAAAFVSGQFNLSRARGLAAAGKEVEAQQEILDQIQRSGDFRQQDYFTQKALAGAAGMEVGEINKLLTNREKLNSLSVEQQKLAEDAIKNGFDITNIEKEDLATQLEVFATQQEQQKVLDKISNQFTGIATSVGSVLMPLLEAVLLVLAPIQYTVEAIQSVFGAIGGYISKLIGPLKEVGKVMKSIASLAIVYAAYKAFGAMGNPILGGIAAAAVLTAGFATLAKIGDLNSPADGKTIVSTKEGGIFQLSPNDDLVAAPGASQMMQNLNQRDNTSVEMVPQQNLINAQPLVKPEYVSPFDNQQRLNERTDKVEVVKSENSGTDKLISTIERLEKAYMRGAQVNLDGQKVIRGLGRVGDETTQNNFSLI